GNTTSPRDWSSDVCSSDLAESEEEFAEQDSRHHPVAFFLQAKCVLRHRLFPTAFRGERLRETETKQFVFRLARDERLKMFAARKIGRESGRQKGDGAGGES